jgi:integrase/recombinase XerD
LRPFSAVLPTPRPPEELRAFQLHLTKNGAQPLSINATMTALRFFFKVTLDPPETTRHLVFVSHSAVRVILQRAISATPG